MSTQQQQQQQPRTAFLDHVGLAVPDLRATKRYYDDLMPILGLKQWWPTGDDGTFAIGPDGAMGPQLFFYQALDTSDPPYSQHRTGLQHLSFMVQTRQIVDEAHGWATDRGDEVLHLPRVFPEYGDHHYATFWLDLNGFKLEAVSYADA